MTRLVSPGQATAVRVHSSRSSTHTSGSVCLSVALSGWQAWPGGTVEKSARSIILFLKLLFQIF